MIPNASSPHTLFASLHAKPDVCKPRRAGVLQRLRARLDEAAAAHSDAIALLRHMAHDVRTAVGATWIVYVPSEHAHAAEAASRLHVLAGDPAAISAEWSDRLADSARRALAENALSVQKIGSDPPWYAAAVPLPTPEQPATLIAVFDRPIAGQRVASVLGLTADRIAVWDGQRRLARYRHEAHSATALAELASQLAAAETQELACHIVVDRFQHLLDCRQVILGTCRRGRACRVAAISGSAAFDRRSERARSIEAVLDEAIVRNDLSVWPPIEPAERHGLMAHKRLAESAPAAMLLSAPIRDEQGVVQGAWVFLGDHEFGSRPQSQALIEAAGPIVGSCLGMLRRAERSALGRGLRRAAGALRRWPGRLAVAAAGLLIAVMFLPAPYRVRCACQLEPVVRRYVAAPFDARLEKSLVEPGDLVRQGQVLAEIDGREIRWEQAGLAAERHRAAKERDGHLATHEFGAAELARCEMERLENQAQLLTERGRHLQIQSPIDGVVITGDLKTAEGVPLAVGQTLFEIAPLDEMIVEIAIPEQEIRHVHVGQPLEIVLDAFPRRRLQSALARIHPRSEFREDEHVFIGEVRLQNPEMQWRPGMHGTAKIAAGRHAVGWNLLHKPWEKMLYWIGW